MSPAGPPPSPTPSPPGKKAVFLRRLTSTLALWGLVVAAIAVGTNPLFYILLGALGLASCREYAAMDPSIPSPWRWIFLAVSLVWTAVTFTITARTGFPWSPIVDLGFIAAITIAAFLPSLFHPLDGRNTLWAIAWTILGFLYIPWSWSFMSRLLFHFGHSPDGRLSGVPYVLFVIAVTKMTDSGAYVVGSLIGRHKMIPHISPGKTWEGLLGASLGALIGGFTVYFGFRHALPLLTPGHVAVLSLVLAAVCIVGDLAESVVKRSLAIKDSGAILPGIGGALDLIDSLLWTAPVFYFLLKYVLPTA
jgi:phosphatidate cytidylyltransferase